MPSYFSHDSNARNSKKIIRLRQKHGAAGYGVYFMLLERLREENNYFSVLDYDMLAFDLRVDAELIRSVVEDFELFEISCDGKCFHSLGFDERMSLVAKKSEAGKKGAESRWKNNDKNEDIMAQNGKTMAEPMVEERQNPESANGIKLNKNKINKIKDSYSFQEEEKEEDVFLLSSIFFKNWAAPNEEYRKFVAFNHTGNRKWDEWSFAERKAALELWKQKPTQKPRMQASHLRFWKRIFETLQQLGAPADIRLDALADDIAIDTPNNDSLLISCHSQRLRDYIERHLDAFKPSINKFQKEFGLNPAKVMYRWIDSLP